MALDFSRPLHLPLAAGVDLRAHEYALEAPGLRVCQNALFSKPGALTKRWGHSPLVEAKLVAQAKGSDNTSGLTVVTDSLAPKPKQLILVWVAVKRGAATPVVSSVSGNGITYDLVESQIYDGSRSLLACYRGMSNTPTTGAITITFTANVDCAAWKTEIWDGVNTGGSNGSAAIGANEPSVAAGQSSLQATYVGGSALNKSSVAFAWDDVDAVPIFASPGWDLGDDLAVSVVNGANEVGAFFDGSTTHASVMDATFSPSVDAAAVIVEIVAAKGIEIDGGGTLTNIRGLFTHQGELCACANERIYSWSEASRLWYDRGPYIGVVPSAESILNDTSDRFGGDFAQANGVQILVWQDSVAGAAFRARDAETGAWLSDVFTIDTSASTAPQVRAVGDYILLWCKTGDTLMVRVINTLNLATINTSTAAVFVDTNQPNFTYDVVVKSATQAIVVYQRDNAGADQYGIAFSDVTGTASGTSNKTRVSTEGTPIVCCYEPNLDRVAVFFRDADPDLQGDILNGSSLADISVGVEVDGNAPLPSQMTCAFRETAEGGGAYRAIVAYNASNVELRVKYLDTGGGFGSIAGPGSSNWKLSGAVVGIGARAIGRGSHVYFGGLHFNTDFGPDIPGTFFLYRDDGHIVARLFTGYGYDTNDVHPVPQLQEIATDVYAGLLTYRPRRGDIFFFGHALKYVTFDFASDRPYQAVQIGKTAYLPGGYLSQYDGVSAVEAGFHISPELNVSGTPASGGTGLSAGDYFYKGFWEWYNDQGERDVSTFVRVHQATTALNDEVTFLCNSLHDTLKRFSAEEGRGNASGAGGISLVLTRTPVAGGELFFQVTDPNPIDSGADNDHPFNQVTTSTFGFTDSMTDTALVAKAPAPFTGGELDATPAEFCSVMAQGQGRIFLAGHENPDLVTFSKFWQPDQVVQFNDALQILLPRDGGRVTALAPLDTSVLIFKEHRIYRVDGVGPTNLGQGAYAEPQLISADTGCVAGAPIVQTPRGWMFVSPKGIRITDGVSVGDIGGPVDEYVVAGSWASALLLEDENMVLFLADSAISALHGEDAVTALAYDYSVGQWSTWTGPIGPAVLWNGTYVYTDGTAILRRSTTKLDAGVPYKLIAEIPFLVPAGHQGRVKGRRLSVKGKHAGDHKLRVRTAFDLDPAWIQDKQWSVEQTKYVVRMGLKQRRFTAIKVRVEDEANGTSPLKDSCELVALSLEIGLRPGLQKQSSGRSM